MNLSQLKTSSILAQCLKYPKRKFAEAVEQSLKENDMVFFNLDYFEYIDSVTDLRNLQFYCSAQTEKNLNKLWNWSKLKATNVYGEFTDMCQNFGEDLVFTYCSASDVFVVRRDDSYSGVGGIFVREDSSTSGVVIEPFKNFFKSVAPLSPAD